MSSRQFSGFGSDTINFLKQLAENNNRDWFAENKSRYERCVVDPAFQFISSMGNELDSLSSHFEAVPKKQGGSLMRVYRDTRFGKDKTPYKTNIGIQFRHEAGKDVHAPGYYMHIEPDNVFVGVGGGGELASGGEESDDIPENGTSSVRRMEDFGELALHDKKSLVFRPRNRFLSFRIVFDI